MTLGGGPIEKKLDEASDRAGGSLSVQFRKPAPEEPSICYKVTFVYRGYTDPDYHLMTDADMSITPGDRRPGRTARSEVKGSAFDRSSPEPIILPRGIPAAIRKEMTAVIVEAGHLQQLHVEPLRRLVETRQRLRDAYQQIDRDGMVVIDGKGTPRAHPLLVVAKGLEGVAATLERQLLIAASSRAERMPKAERGIKGAVAKRSNTKKPALVSVSPIDRSGMSDALAQALEATTQKQNT
jgi:hypothetical protein